MPPGRLVVDVRGPVAELVRLVGEVLGVKIDPADVARIEIRGNEIQIDVWSQGLNGKRYVGKIGGAMFERLTRPARTS